MMKKSVRSFFILTFVLILVASLTACGSPAGNATATNPSTSEDKTQVPTEQSNAEEPAATKELNIFTWAEYVPTAIVEEFEDATGIKVNYSNFDTNEEMLSKIQAQKNQFDIIICSDYIIDIMAREGGLMQEIDWTKVPNSANIDPAYQSSYYDPENKYATPYAAASGMIVYDKTKVDFEVKGYADLWNEAFKNKLVLLDGDRDIIGMTAMKVGYSVNETDPAKLEEIKQEMLNLKPNVVAFNANDPHNSIINGDAVAGYMYNSQASAAARAVEGLEIVYPAEGMTFYVDNIIIPTGAPNLQNAYSFLNYILDGEVSAKISETIEYPNLNTAAKAFLSQEYLDNKAINFDKAQINNPQAVRDVGETATIYSDIWTEFKSN